MVRKLFKYEFRSYLRTMIPLYVIILAIAMFGRIVQFFESDSIVYDIAFSSSVVAFAMGAITLVIMTEIIGVVRFYKNLYTSEGYLTFTLPVTSSQHIFVKLATLVIFSIFALAVLIASVATITAGDVLVEIIRTVSYIVTKLHEAYGADFYILAAEMLLLMLVVTVYTILLYYTCISIGQKAKKNRIFMAILVYFAYYIIEQIISTAFVIIATLLGTSNPTVIAAIEWAVQNPIDAMHIALPIAIVFVSALSVLWFTITNRIMKHSLNLE